jgi:hypothetical protein
MSVTLEAITSRRPGMSDEQAIADYARETGFHVVVLYEDRSGETIVKGLFSDRELQEVRSSPYASNVRIIYDDGRLQNYEQQQQSQADFARRRMMEEFAKGQANQPLPQGEPSTRKWWQFWR